MPKLYRWLTRLVNPRPVEPPPPPEPVAAPAATPPVYDAGAALDAYARSCARYAVSANGAVLGALRFGGVCVKPSDESGGAPFGDADLLAVVDAICDPASVARALDLTRVDGARFTQACAARALSHALAKADRGRGLAYLALVGAPLGPRGAERLATAATPQLRALRLQGCDARDAGLDAFAQALGERLPQLERLDVSRNRASLHACKRLKKAAKSRGMNGGAKCRVELRGNCLALEMACAATHAAGHSAGQAGRSGSGEGSPARRPLGVLQSRNENAAVPQNVGGAEPDSLRHGVHEVQHPHANPCTPQHQVRCARRSGDLVAELVLAI